MDPQIQYLLARKQKADSLPAEVRTQFAEEYANIVFELAMYAMAHPMPYWDEIVNDAVLQMVLRAFAEKYEPQENRPFVSWMFDQAVNEIDVSYHTRDQVRLFNCIQGVRMQLGKV